MTHRISSQTVPLGRGAKISRNPVRILGARGVTRSKFISDSPQMLGATAQNLMAREHDARDL